jgi:hypothetical protein
MVVHGGLKSVRKSSHLHDHWHSKSSKAMHSGKPGEEQKKTEGNKYPIKGLSSDTEEEDSYFEEEESEFEDSEGEYEGDSESVEQEGMESEERVTESNLEETPVEGEYGSSETNELTPNSEVGISIEESKE